MVNKLNGQALSTPQTTEYKYDTVGNLLTTTQDEGTATTADDLVTIDTYDVLNRLDTLTAKVKGVTIFDQDYSHTSDGQKHDVLEHRYNASGILNGTTRTTWGYDDDGHLTSEQRDEGDDQVQNGGDYTDTFAFDLNGNRQSKTHDAVGTAGDVVTTSTYNDRNELKTMTTNGVTSPTIVYDPDGNTLSDGSTVYTWDLRNRMLTVTVPSASGPVTTTYAYDESGVRVSKTTNGTKTTFLNDSQNLTGYAKPVEEWIGGTLSRTYIIGITVLGQADATGSITDILRDGRGYARSLVASGVVIQNIDYGAYGNPQNGITPATAAASPDGYRDAETGSYYQNARFRLDGRWFSEDDITQTAGDYRNANLFSFVGGDPMNGTDPSGHDGLAGTLVSMGINSVLQGLKLSIPLRAFGFAKDIISGASIMNATENALIGLLEHSALSFGFGAALSFFKFARPLMQLRQVGSAFTRAAESVWNLAPFERGIAIERMILGRLPSLSSVSNFPVIDDFVRGVATSIKSLDLTAASYQNVSALTSRLSFYARSLSGFTGAVKGGLTVAGSAIKDRVLLVVVEDGAATGPQWQALTDFQKSAAAQWPNVKVIFQFTK